MVLRKRWTSRVLLADERDRLLLLCGRDPRKPGSGWWFTAGGGGGPGEEYPRAAVREVREETAPDLPARRLGPVVWMRQALFRVDGQGFDQYEEYRLLRVTAEEAGAMRVGTDEARYGRHWWTIEELTTTRVTVVRPKNTAALLPGALRNGEPRAEPFHLGHVNEDTDSG
ncbi:ADP-ribose pyrophosphatase YjhB (NUDIX family) [Spinactinospora alkalitolerans]|uniref:ADP-ribose pyrophosphatase YjhB (NUDIX family) n=1 Tax=Spinactinospora alkalitolerans TaxID=687207 RepID=A0A852U6C3_9ACTN|nr:NUDIX domain-containing protein [Spinactinospora alkalitolerans]NYE50423.1 ADP-ribose pyrophosphatase YjhB (NUDIX family) [Spinactinospora alkalitolerans]